MKREYIVPMLQVVRLDSMPLLVVLSQGESTQKGDANSKDAPDELPGEWWGDTWD